MTACIVYVQGSAGNLLARCLTLDENTVPYGKKKKVEDRLVEYNNWNSNNWIDSEVGLEIDYMQGNVHFHIHETSELKLVHRLHPEQFLHGEKILWTGDYKWKNLIFIEPNDLNTIVKLATLKRPDLDHKTQIPAELETYKTLLLQANYILPFTDMFEENNFLKHVETLCTKLDIKFYKEYVKETWTKWYDETCKLIYCY